MVYDSQGRVTEIGHPDPKHEPNDKFVYDAHGLSAVEVESPTGKTYTWERESDGYFHVKLPREPEQKAHITLDGYGNVRWSFSNGETFTRASNGDMTSQNALYAHKDDPLKDIKPDNVQQGDLGDCYFLSSLASVAQHNPQAIEKMIHDNGNGSYTITFR